MTVDFGTDLTLQFVRFDLVHQIVNQHQIAVFDIILDKKRICLLFFEFDVV